MFNVILFSIIIIIIISIYIFATFIDSNTREITENYREKIGVWSRNVVNQM